jgi:hypothetical protein
LDRSRGTASPRREEAEEVLLFEQLFSVFSEERVDRALFYESSAKRRCIEHLSVWIGFPCTDQVSSYAREIASTRCNEDKGLIIPCP